MTKFDCPGCGKHFTLCANDAVTADFRRRWEAEHAECQAAYRAALALVDWLEPEPGLDRAWKVGDVWYEGLYEVLGALENVRH